MRSFTIGIHALIGWALCGSIIGIGRTYTSMGNTLIIHAILVPIIFGLVSLIYFKKFNYTTPLETAVIFFVFAVVLDVVVVAQFIEKSYRMFLSPLGTWIPFISIFMVTYLVGTFTRKKAGGKS
ncbi:MAG: hypothetical protein KJ732_01510 [Candidatus Margulisbacteria bacterium]|nr:hypothetical protein [Candidatus Margulisiibacteriota bacterium]